MLSWGHQTNWKTGYWEKSVEHYHYITSRLSNQFSVFICSPVVSTHKWSGMYIHVMYAYVVIVDTVLDSTVRYESKITQEYRIYGAESIIITIDY